jgi:hypothetical protein
MNYRRSAGDACRNFYLNREYNICHPSVGIELCTRNINLEKLLKIIKREFKKERTGVSRGAHGLHEYSRSAVRQKKQPAHFRLTPELLQGWAALYNALGSSPGHRWACTLARLARQRFVRRREGQALAN